MGGSGIQFIPVAESVALRAEYEDQYNHFSPFKGLYYANIPLVLPYRKSSVVWSSLKVLQQLKLSSTDRSLTPGCSQIPLWNPGCHSPPFPSHIVGTSCHCMYTGTVWYRKAQQSLI